MPIYEYRCTQCAEVTEALQRMSDPALTDCLSCGESGSGTLQKLFSAHVVGAVAPPRACASPRPDCGRCSDPQAGCGLPN